MLSHRIIEVTIKDDSDYDWLYDSALQNTLKEHFDWSDKTKADVSFLKSYDGEKGYGLKLCVDATFTNKQDFALYKITFGFGPLKKFNEGKNMEPYFE